MVVGILIGKLAPGLTASLSRMEFGQGSQVNVPIAVLIWLMICPMMLKVDFGSIGGIARRPKGLLAHPVCELADQALQHGLLRVAVHSEPVHPVD